MSLEDFYHNSIEPNKHANLRDPEVDVMVLRSKGRGVEDGDIQFSRLWGMF